MVIRVLPSLSRLVHDAFRLARSRLGTLVSLALFPLIPFALFGPFVAQVLVAIEEEMSGPAVIATRISLWTAALAFLGLVLGFVVSVASAAGMFVALGKSADQGARAAFRDGTRAWFAFAWTQFLAALAVFVTAVPGLFVFWWVQRVLGEALAGNLALRLLILLVPLLLVVPTFVVASWYAFALIPAARGEALGPAALAVSHRLVEGAVLHVFGLFLAWAVAEVSFWVLLELLFPGLTLFKSVVHYLAVSILGSAYLVVVYQALRRS